MTRSLIQRHPFFIRLFNWEYWPAQAIYIPMLFYFLWLLIRGRQPQYFTAANPGIYFGGMGVESKYETLQKIPEKLRPVSVLVKAGDSFDQTLQKLHTAGIGFPLFAKPDIGFRGLLVKRIATAAELEAYLSRFPLDFIVQGLIDYPMEVGVLYYRMPDEKQGTVSSLTLKEFLYVTGDGVSTVLELVKNKPRALLQLDRLRDTHAAVLDTVPPAGQQVSLGAVGNHSKGTRFIDGCHLITPELCAHFDRLSHQMEGIYYGRFDLKCQSLDDLVTGEHLKVIELNGVCAEPTHIYDPKHSFFYGLRQTARHWRILTLISTQTRRNGFVPPTPRTTIKAIFSLRPYAARIKALAQAEGKP